MDDFIGRLIADARVDHAAAAHAAAIPQFLINQPPKPLSPVVGFVSDGNTTPASVGSTRSSSPRSCGGQKKAVGLRTSPMQGVAPSTTSLARQTAEHDAAGNMIGAVSGRYA
jgi:hypothetical protein